MIRDKPEAEAAADKEPEKPQGKEFTYELPKLVRDGNDLVLLVDKDDNA